MTGVCLSMFAMYNMQQNEVQNNELAKIQKIGQRKFCFDFLQHELFYGTRVRFSSFTNIYFFFFYKKVISHCKKKNYLYEMNIKV